jgi:hypothetical protein
MESQKMLPKIVGGLVTYGGAAFVLDKAQGGTKLASKLCLLATVDLRTEEGVSHSVTTLDDLMTASGIKSG